MILQIDYLLVFVLIGATWGVKFEPIYWFIFHSIFIPNGGDGGQVGGEIWVYY